MKKTDFTVRYVKSTLKSYILIKYLEDEKPVRKRPTFNLNRIKFTPFRNQLGKKLEEKINYWLVNGYDVDDLPLDEIDLLYNEVKSKENIFENEPSNTNQVSAKIKTSKKKKYKKYPYVDKKVTEALEEARKIKGSFQRKHTNEGYSSHIDRFIDWLKLKEYDDMTCNEFSHRIAIEFLDYYQHELKRRNTTVNNVFIHQRAIWYALQKRGWIKVNPFVGWKRLRPEKKIRRKFSSDEAKIVLSEIYEKDMFLFYAVIIMYGCFIRRSELRRLHFFDVFINEGVIVVPADCSKNWSERTCTIPEFLIHYFKSDFWTKYPKDFFIFGDKGKPDQYKPCEEDMLTKRHRKIIKNLHKLGKISNIEGITLYSWKDTGITDAIKQFGLIVAMDQADHKDAKTTLKYYEKPRISKIRQLDNKYLAGVGTDK